MEPILSTVIYIITSGAIIVGSYVLGTNLNNNNLRNQKPVIRTLNYYHRYNY
jgi:hypothetical protein